MCVQTNAAAAATGSNPVLMLPANATSIVPTAPSGGEAGPSGAAANATLKTATTAVATVLSELDVIHEKLPWAQPIDLPTLRMTYSST